MSRYFLGVDGGGTKTEFMLTDADGESIFKICTKGCGHFQYGFAGFTQGIFTGKQKILQLAEISEKDIVSVCAGVSSFGESKTADEKICGIMRELFPLSKLLILNDVDVALAGSLCLKPGINIVAGTGSIVSGIDENNTRVRSGGWGEYCGDEGSAYWLGRKALALFCKQSDGRIKKGPLHEVVRNALGLEEDIQIIEYCYNTKNMKRDLVADKQKLLYEAALKGDSSAIEAYIDGAQELALAVESVIGQLNFEGKEISVSYSGGLFNVGKLITEPLESMLAKLNAHLRAPLLSPISGALLLAANNLEGIGIGKLSERLANHEKSKP